MSFAVLKTLLFGTAIPPSSSPASSRRPSTAETITNVDLEAQPLLGGSRKTADQQPKGSNFKVDARVISDATIGLSDGLTVPFALTAGLSALGDTKVVIFGGLAELIAGAISMGLGGYLGAKSEMASYQETRLQTAAHLAIDPTAVATSVSTIFSPFSVPAPILDGLTKHLTTTQSENPDMLVDFITRFEHGAEEPASSRALTSACTIALAYFFGGLVPLLPYLFVDDVLSGLYVSVAVMAVALFAFGYLKTGVVVGWKGSRCVTKSLTGGLQMMVVGGAAAGAAMGLVKLFDGMAGE